MAASFSAPSSPAGRHKTATPAWGDEFGQVRNSASKSTSGSPLRVAYATSGPNAAPGSPLQQLSRAVATMGSPGRSPNSLAELHELEHSQSPVLSRTQQQMHSQMLSQRDVFHPGVKHAGWLWKRFGHGHKTVWKRLWFYLIDDRLCYFAAEDPTGSPTRNLGDPGSTALYAASQNIADSNATFSSSMFGSTAASAAALAAGKVKYIALDRIPVRPLPHRPQQHAIDPMQRSNHPDVGIAIIDARVLTGRPVSDPQRTVFSIVAGSHTHYLAAETPQEAQLWVSLIRETWLHCFSHVARSTGTVERSGVVVSQQLIAENEQLRSSVQELKKKVSDADYDYWRKWVEEKAKFQELELRLLHTVHYEIRVKTGSMKGAGTDARVYLELFARDYTGPTSNLTHHINPTNHPISGASGDVRLHYPDSDVKPFQRGAVDTFTVQCHDVGLPGKLRIGHDNTGRHPDWFLEEVKVRKEGTADWVTFPCNKWFSVEQGDQRIRRELVAGSGRPRWSYRVVVYTSDIRGAGTDANVYIQLHGVLGDGNKYQLLGGASAFDRGVHDEFVIEDVDLGELTAVTVSHDSSGKSPAWHLDHIKVTRLGFAPQQTPTDTNNTPNEPARKGDGSPMGKQQLLHARDKSGSPTAQQALQAELQFNAGKLTGNPEAGVAGVVPAGVTYVFPCGAWLDERLGDGTTERRLTARPLDPMVWYNIYITTADVRGAGTDAEVYVALIGSKASSGRVVLSSRPEHFERGNRDKFRLQLPHLGILSKLVIGHDNRGESPLWKLELVEVEEEQHPARITYFAADRWLGTSSPDGLSEVTLTASDIDPRQAQVEYQACFITSSLRGAGTDSTVGFELRGDRGTTGPITVSAGKAAFERGCKGMFSYVRPWLGQLLQLVVWHDNGGAAAGRGPWHLEAVTVRNSRDQQVVTFPCNRWLSAETQLRVELQPGKATGLVRYQFDVVTSDIRGAGTDGAVCLELFGQTDGSSAAVKAGPWCLDKPGAFARGQTDVFTVQGSEVQHPTSLQVTLQGAGANPDWHLSYIVCTVFGREDNLPGAKYYFVADRWFDDKHGLSATLSATKPVPEPRNGQLPYMVKVYTSDLKGAGTDANVWVNMIGVKGSSGWQQLRARRESFERGQEDVFVLKVPFLGSLTRIGVKSDGTGEGAAWHLNKVCIIPPASPTDTQQTGHPVWFVAKRWLDAANGLEVTLDARAEDLDGRQVTYTVEVYTSDIKHAGTESRVFMQLSGDNGDSGPVELQNHESANSSFKTGGTDVFKLQLLQLGELQRLKVWLEERGSPWHLELIVVYDPEGKPTYFPCGRWLGTAQAGHPVSGTASSPLELTGQTEDPRPAMTDYKVVIRTSDIPGAGTDATVYVELIATDGKTSGRTHLNPEDPTAFDRGRVDEYKLRCSKLGELAQLRIGHDNKGRHPGWHLLQVEVTELSPEGDGRTWYFAADCWLDASQGDRRTERLLTASRMDPLADRVSYKVSLHTSNIPGAAKNETAAVYITLQGSHGTPITSTATGNRPLQSPSLYSNGGDSAMLSSPRLELTGNSKMAFVEGGVGSFTLPLLKDLGQLRRLTLELEGKSQGQQCSWHCQHIEVTHSDTNERWLFPCNAWLGNGHNAGVSEVVLQPVPHLPLPPPPPPPPPPPEPREDKYTVAIYTSEVSPVAYDVTVSITMYGATGEAGPLELGEAGRSGFKQGGAESFAVSTVAKLGQLQRLKVVVASLKADSSLYLDAICIVAEATGVATWFYAGRWFDKVVGTTAVLEGSTVDIRAQLVRYKIALHTADSSPTANPPGRLYVELHGSNTSSSGPQLLSGTTSSKSGSGKDNGRRHGEVQTDTFVVKALELNRLQELLLWVDADGVQSDWQLAYVDVQHMNTGQTWYFPAGQWPERPGDGATPRVLKVDNNFLCSYRIIVTTGNIRMAGTDANVYIIIYGNKGNTSRKELHTPGRNCFERGQTDVFQTSGVDVGVMSHIVIGHDGTGMASAWYLGTVEVEHLTTGQKLYFTANRWLDDKNNGNPCELWPAPPPPPGPQINWELVVITGRAFGSGTDADVFIKLTGEHGTFGPHQLPAGPEAFNIGCRDTFQLATPDIGTLQEVTISHNNMGAAAAWFLQALELKNLNMKVKYVFKIAAWLDVANGLSRTLKPMPQKPGPVDVQGSTTCSYQIEIQTSNLDGAGTDAGVFVQIGGVLGETESLQLQAPGANTNTITARPMFQRGAQDVFVLRGLQDVGALTHLQIGHDGTGQHPAWHLSWVRVVNLTTGTRALFIANTWLDPSIPHCNSWIRLPASPDAPQVATVIQGPQQPQQQQQPGELGGLGLAGENQTPRSPLRMTKNWLQGNRGEPGYKLTFLTSNIWGAGTGSKVFFELIGEHGTSGVVYAASQPGQFDRGHKDTFLYPRLPYLGQLSQLRVGTDGAGMFAAWHLRQVEVVHVHSGQRWLFQCHDWIDKKCNFQKLLPAAGVAVLNSTAGF